MHPLCRGGKHSQRPAHRGGTSTGPTPSKPWRRAAQHCAAQGGGGSNTALPCPQGAAVPAALTCSTFRQWPVERSHSLAVPSSEAVPASWPSSLTATQLMRPLCPASTCLHVPLFRFHTLRGEVKRGAFSLCRVSCAAEQRPSQRRTLGTSDERIELSEPQMSAQNSRNLR